MYSIYQIKLLAYNYISTTKVFNTICRNEFEAKRIGQKIITDLQKEGYENIKIISIKEIIYYEVLEK